MWDFLKAIFYGIIEGITEWLPISSTGHLILLEEAMPFTNVSDGFYEMFQVVIQLAAIVAVVLLFFRKLNPFDPGKKPRQKQMTWSLWFKVVIAVLPSAVLGVLLNDFLDEHLYNFVVVAITLIVYGVGFIWVEQRNAGSQPRIKGVHGIDLKTALLIGCFQCLSLIPGTSRSGATILGAIFLGVSRSGASEFSFFLAIPTMLGASLLKILDFIVEGNSMAGNEVLILITGCIVSFAVSFLVIRKLMEYVKANSFRVFGVYRIALGGLVILYALLKLIFK